MQGLITLLQVKTSKEETRYRTPVIKKTPCSWTTQICKYATSGVLLELNIKEELCKKIQSF